MSEDRRPNSHTSPILRSRKEGFANVARWIALDPDGETFVFRKFSELTARNLLYLQSEILALEEDFGRLDTEDAQSDDMNLKDAARTWETLSKRCEFDDQSRARMDLILRLRAKLKEYHEALLLQNEIKRMRRPDRRSWTAFKRWFKQPYPALGGRAKTFLDDREDLVALASPSESDYLSYILRKYWPVKGEPSRDGSYSIGRFNERNISIAVVVISTLIAAILLVGSIVALYFASSDVSKLGMIAAFTAAFAASVGLITNARRAEIFAATAAYAAVLVVFVSGDLSNSQISPET